MPTLGLIERAFTESLAAGHLRPADLPGILALYVPNPAIEARLYTVAINRLPPEHVAQFVQGIRAEVRMLLDRGH